jgi:hypothetical protein
MNYLWFQIALFGSLAITLVLALPKLISDLPLVSRWEKLPWLAVLAPFFLTFFFLFLPETWWVLRWAWAKQ